LIEGEDDDDDKALVVALQMLAEQAQELAGSASQHSWPRPSVPK
jgi:hypothetical protein